LTKKVSIKMTSAIFLAFVLVVGTFALSILSFSVEAQATSDREKDYDNDKKDSYGKDRDKDDDESRNHDKEYDEGDEKSYGKDKDDDKSKKDSNNSVFVKKVKCNNINLNLNGVDVDIGLPINGPIAVAQEAEDDDEEQESNSIKSSDDDESDEGKDRQSDSETNSRIVCINNNNNIIVEQEEPEPSTGTLKVTKEVTCEDNTQGQLCEEFEALITEDQFLFQVTGNNPDQSSQFPGSSTGTDVILGPGNYVVTEAEEEAFENIDIFLDNHPEVTVITGDHSFTGDCTQFGGGGFLEFQARGTIAAGELQTCNAINAFTID
jgi:hypothetical protein